MRHACLLFIYYIHSFKSEYFKSYVIFKEFRKNDLVLQWIFDDININIEYNWLTILVFSLLHFDKLVYWQLKDNILRELFERFGFNYDTLAYPHIELIKLFYWNKNIWKLVHGCVTSWHCSFLMNCQSFKIDFHDPIHKYLCEFV